MPSGAGGPSPSSRIKAIVDAGRPGERVTSETARPGFRVVRGRDWSWEDQDGGRGHVGEIMGGSRSPGWVRVVWKDTGRDNSYRAGAEGEGSCVTCLPPACPPVCCLRERPNRDGAEHSLAIMFRRFCAHQASSTSSSPTRWSWRSRCPRARRPPWAAALWARPWAPSRALVSETCELPFVPCRPVCRPRTGAGNRSGGGRSPTFPQGDADPQLPRLWGRRERADVNRGDRRGCRDGRVEPTDPCPMSGWAVLVVQPASLGCLPEPGQHGDGPQRAPWLLCYARKGLEGTEAPIKRLLKRLRARGLHADMDLASARAPQWEDQDGGPGSIGTLQEAKDRGWWSVLWRNGNLNVYRVGKDGQFDLAFAEPVVATPRGSVSSVGTASSAPGAVTSPASRQQSAAPGAPTLVAVASNSSGSPPQQQQQQGRTAAAAGGDVDNAVPRGLSSNTRQNLQLASVAALGSIGNVESPSAAACAAPGQAAPNRG